MTLSEKIAGVADQSAIESLIEQGEYAQSEQDVEKLIANLRDLEAAYEDAILASSTLVREEERLTERGVVFSSKKGEVDVLIVEGAYDKAVRRSVAIIKEYLKRENAWLKAQEIVVILGSEVERVTEKGVVIPESFDIASVGVLMYEGEYTKAGRKAKSLIQKIRALENAFNDASTLFGLLLRERNRLEVKGVPLPDATNPFPVKTLLDAGDYANAGVGAQEILDLLKTLEEAYDRAIQMVDLLGSEISRVSEKGVVLPAGISLDPVLDAILAGDFDGAADTATDLIRQIREIEADYDRAVDVAGQIRDGSERLKGFGISVPFAPSEIDDLITAGRYDEAIARTQEMLKSLADLEAERLLNERSIKAFQDELDREIWRLKDRGINVPYTTATLASLIDAEEEEKAWEEAGNLLAGLRDLENLFDAANRARDRLVAETKRIRADGIVVPDYTGEVAKQMAAGDYRMAWEAAGDHLLSVLLIERDALDAGAALAHLRTEIARLKKKGVVITDESDLVENLIDEEKTAAAKEAAASQLRHHLMTEGRFDATVTALKNSEDQKNRLLKKGIIVPDIPTTIGDLMKNGAYYDALDTIRSFVGLLIAADNQYNAAVAALGALSDELSRLRKKGVLVPDNRAAVEALISDGNYIPAQERVRTEIILLRSLESGYDVAQNARKALTKRIVSLKKKGVVIPFSPDVTDALLEKGDYSGALSEMHVLAQNLSATESAFNEARKVLKTLKSEVSRLTKKGLLVPDSLPAVEEMIASGDYPESQKFAATALRTLIVLESAYDGALEALAALKQEIARLLKKGVLVPDRTGIIEDMIRAGTYREARTGAYDEIVSLRVIEQEFIAFMRSMERCIAETDRLLTLGVKITDERPSVQKMADDGKYPEAVFQIAEMLDGYRIIEFEFESAHDALTLLNREIARLKKKGVVFAIVPGPTDTLIADGEYRKAREEANLLVSDLRATESLFDSALGALSLLNKEIARLKKKGVVIPEEIAELQAFIKKGEYHTARSTAEVTISELRRTESDYNAAVEALKGLEREIVRIEGRGIIMTETSAPVIVLIEKGSYSASRSEVSAIIQRLKKIEIAYESALEALNTLETEIQRIGNMGVLLPVTTQDITALLASGAYGEAVSAAEKINTQVRNIEIEYTAAIDALGDLVAEISRLHDKGVIIDDDITAVHLAIEKGSYAQARTIAEDHLSVIRAAEIEYDSALSTRAELKAEIQRLTKKSVRIDADTGPVEKLIKTGAYRKAKDQADSHLSALKKTEREYDGAIGALEQVQDEIKRLVRKGVVITEDVIAIKTSIKEGAYKKATTVADKMQGRLRERESDYDAAISSLKSYLREQERVAENGVPVPEESAAIRAYIELGEYSQARSEAESLVSRVKSFEWEYELTMSAYESLKSEVERLKAQGIVITDDPAQVEEFIESGQYQHAKSISEGLLSKIKTTEWEYGLAKKALEALERETVSGKNGKKGMNVDTEGIKTTIREGRYRKAKSMAEELISTLRS